MSLQQIVAIKGYIQTTYLAVYPDKLLLLDSGCYGDVDNILNYITDTLNRPVTQLKAVVVTHMHPDHAGGAALLKKKTGCQIISSVTYKPWYEGVKGRLSHLNDLALTYYVANRQDKPLIKIWYDPILQPDIEAKDGDTVPGFEDWVILQTPGHTDHDLSLWHEPSQQIYTADLILKIKDKYMSPFLITLPHVYRASLNKVKALRPRTVLLAHGEKCEIAQEEFDRLLKKAPKHPREVKLTAGLNFNLPQFRFARKRGNSKR